MVGLRYNTLYMANSNLTSAKKAKNDEFYTQFNDIQKEIEAYLDFDPDTFRGKVVYCNCDDPLESNFFKFFALNFNRLGLRRLITTSYKPSPIAGTLFPLEDYTDTEALPKSRPKERAYRFVVDSTGDLNGDGRTDIKDIYLKLRKNQHNELVELHGDKEYSPGDFRSQESVELLKQADIVVTNPPFSLFREYVAQLVEFDKKFLIIGNMNAITYKEIFPLIKDDKLWLGNGFSRGNAYFEIPSAQRSDYAEGVYDEKTGLVKFRNVNWFTNLDHGRRHQPLQLRDTRSIFKRLKHKVFVGKTEFDRYDNYDAIEVPFTDSIPSDYDGVMGVPISFLDKYSPEQFEILGATESEGRGFSDGLWDEKSGVSQPVVKGERVYKRIFIKHRKGQN